MYSPKVRFYQISNIRVVRAGPGNVWGAYVIALVSASVSASALAAKTKTLTLAITLKP